MSSFRKWAGVLFLWKRHAVDLTAIKLSCILLVLMKALWHGETMEGMNLCNLSARALVMIFTKEWIRLIGLKSPTESAPSFLGIRIMLAELISCRLEDLREWKAFAASIISCLMMSQQVLRKVPVKPSGLALCPPACDRWHSWFLVLWKAHLAPSGRAVVCLGAPSWSLHAGLVDSAWPQWSEPVSQPPYQHA